MKDYQAQRKYEELPWGPEGFPDAVLDDVAPEEGFFGDRGEKASASDVTPVSSSSFASGGGQPPNNNNGWKIAATVAGGVAAVAGGPITASIAAVGGVVWAINSSNDSE